MGRSRIAFTVGTNADHLEVAISRTPAQLDRLRLEALEDNRRSLRPLHRMACGVAVQHAHSEFRRAVSNCCWPTEFGWRLNGLGEGGSPSATRRPFIHNSCVSQKLCPWNTGLISTNLMSTFGIFALA